MQQQQKHCSSSGRMASLNRNMNTNKRDMAWMVGRRGRAFYEELAVSLGTIIIQCVGVGLIAL